MIIQKTYKKNTYKHNRIHDKKEPEYIGFFFNKKTRHTDGGKSRKKVIFHSSLFPLLERAVEIMYAHARHPMMIAKITTYSGLNGPMSGGTIVGVRPVTLSQPRMYPRRKTWFAVSVTMTIETAYTITNASLTFSVHMMSPPGVGGDDIKSFFVFFDENVLDFLFIFVYTQ